jgi:hypothetical protein
MLQRPATDGCYAVNGNTGWRSGPSLQQPDRKGGLLAGLAAPAVGSCDVREATKSGPLAYHRFNGTKPLSSTGDRKDRSDDPSLLGASWRGP